MICTRPGGGEYPVADDPDVLQFYYDHRDNSAQELTKAVLANTAFWGQDLTQIPGLEEKTAQILALIREKGAAAAFKKALEA